MFAIKFVSCKIVVSGMATIKVKLLVSGIATMALMLPKRKCMWVVA